MQLFVPEIIRRKRDGGSLDQKEIEQIISAYTVGEIPDYQMSALLMAIFFKGMDAQELHFWTSAMLKSGETLDHSALAGSKIDKHSTGGVGDKISIPLAPAVAACGVKVPMISGRGLGHTGGTLDKLESIPGFKTDLSSQKAQEILAETGLFLIGQTDSLAPADRKLYALRDVTGTVESIPLISSSIMSKKLAEGIDGLILDVKVGTGAFINDLEQARLLAETMIRIGGRAGKKVRALLTDMNSPIGDTVGNALEIKESIDVLKGGGPTDTVELTVELGAEMLLLGGRDSDLDQARKRIADSLNNGSAFNVFKQLVALQGGDVSCLDDPSRLPQATQVDDIEAPRAGFISGIHPRQVAGAAVEVGAGRRVKEDPVDPGAGVVLKTKVGDRIETGQVLAELHHSGKNQDFAREKLLTAFSLSDEAPIVQSRIIERL